MNNPFIFVLIALVSAAIGFALGSLATDARAKNIDRAPAPGLEEVVRLWRDVRRNRLFVQMDGKLLRSPREISDAQWMRLAKAVEDLRKSLDMTAGGARKMPAEAEMPKAEAARRPSLSPVDVISRAVTADVPKPTQSKSIAAQIDEILQEKLAASHLENRAVRLLELPGKGMVVMVGLEQYEGVGEVPDPEIRAMIHSSVSEWEKRVGEE